jgi:endogenous inhibitor of DNA gyrase (YacG/DUF329 family)
MVRLPDCPICHKQLQASSAQESEYFPFCSERCRNVDLLRWSDGRYAIVESLTLENLDPELLDELGELDNGDGGDMGGLISGDDE